MLDILLKQLGYYFFPYFTIAYPEEAHGSSIFLHELSYICGIVSVAIEVAVSHENQETGEAN